MSRIVEVVTPEQVAIRYELAGFGTRALAAIVDWLISMLLILLVSIPFLLAYRESIDFENFSVDAISRSIILGIFILIYFIITWGYFIFFETLWNGATPGKRMMGLRVIRDGGFPVDFRAVVIRNLVRAIDMAPVFYAFGFVAVLWHPQYKRMGDLAAGTIVVRHGEEDDDFPDFSYGSTVVLRLLTSRHLALLSRVTREEQRIVQQFLDRRMRLPLALRVEFARRLALPLMEKIDYVLPEFGIDYERWLDELVLASRSRSRGVAPVQAVAATLAMAPSTPSAYTPPVQIPRLAVDQTAEDTRRW